MICMTYVCNAVLRDKIYYVEGLNGRRPLDTSSMVKVVFSVLGVSMDGRPFCNVFCIIGDHRVSFVCMQGGGFEKRR